MGAATPAHNRWGAENSGRKGGLADGGPGGAAGIETYPIELRYAWPSEIDLMARLAGMRLTGRWGEWQGEPFTARSDSHISVWQGRDD